MRGSCPRAAPLAGRGLPGVDDAVPAATLIAWNYLCPAELERILEAHFEPDVAAWAEHEAMRRSLFAALAADPGHVGANVELLLDLAERGEPRQLLQRARRFAYVSGGHPYARLLSGVALERIGRSEDALSELEAGLQGLTQEEAARIRDVRPLLAPGTAELFWSLEREDRGARGGALLGAARPARVHSGERALRHAPGACRLCPPAPGRGYDGRRRSVGSLRQAACRARGRGGHRVAHGTVGNTGKVRRSRYAVPRARRRASSLPRAGLI